MKNLDDAELKNSAVTASVVLGDQLAPIGSTLPSLNTLSKGTFLYSLGNIFNYAVSFLLLPVFTRYLSPQDYGVLSMLNVLAAFLVSMFSLGLGTSIGLCYAEKTTPEHIERTFGSAFFIMACSAGILFVVCSIFSRGLSTQLFHSPEYSMLIRYSVATICFLLLSIPLTSYMQLQHRAAAFVKLTLCSALFTSACRLLWVVGLKKGVTGAVEGLLIGQAFSFLLLLFCVGRSIRLFPSRVTIKRLFILGIPLIPSFAILFLLQKGNQYVLQREWGLHDVGLYTIGYSTGTMMSMLVGGFTTAWTPFFLSFMNKQEEAKAVFSSIFSYYVIVFGFVTVLFFIFAKPFVLLMTHPSFYGAYRVIGLVATSEFFVGIFSLFLPAMYFRHEVKFVPIIQGAAAVLGLLVNWLIIMRLRYIGAALGLTAGMFFMAVFQLSWNRLRGSAYLQIQYELKRLIMAASFYGLLAVLTFIDRPWPLLHEGCLSLILVFVACVGMYQLLTAPERDRFKGYLRDISWRKGVVH